MEAPLYDEGENEGFARACAEAGIAWAAQLVRDINLRVAELLKLVGMPEQGVKYPAQLSGGQQQRVAIARALINQPSLILADEPTGNLDSRTSVEVMGIFQRLNAEHGITVLLITHEHDIAEYATRVVAFKDGRIINNTPVTNRRNAETELASMPAIA